VPDPSQTSHSHNIQSLGGDREEPARGFTIAGLAVYARLTSATSEKNTLITVAISRLEMCLVLAAWDVINFKIGSCQIPTILQVKEPGKPSLRSFSVNFSLKQMLPCQFSAVRRNGVIQEYLMIFPLETFDSISQTFLVAGNKLHFP
jgi:hypothetical protein